MFSFSYNIACIACFACVAAQSICQIIPKPVQDFPVLRNRFDESEQTGLETVYSNEPRRRRRHRVVVEDRSVAPV